MNQPVTRVIHEIAFQSSILALGAALDAAGSGETQPVAITPRPCVSTSSAIAVLAASLHAAPPVEPLHGDSVYEDGLH